MSESNPLNCTCEDCVTARPIAMKLIDILKKDEELSIQESMRILSHTLWMLIEGSKRSSSLHDHAQYGVDLVYGVLKAVAEQQTEAMFEQHAGTKKKGLPN